MRLKKDQLENIKKLSSIFCTKIEISAFLNISLQDFEVALASDRRVAEAMQQGEALGRINIRKSQFELLKEGSADISKFLGKQYLSQLDKPIEDLEQDSISCDRSITINFVLPDESKLT